MIKRFCCLSIVSVAFCTCFMLFSNETVNASSVSNVLVVNDRNMHEDDVDGIISNYVKNVVEQEVQTTILSGVTGRIYTSFVIPSPQAGATLNADMKLNLARAGRRNLQQSAGSQQEITLYALTQIINNLQNADGNRKSLIVFVNMTDVLKRNKNLEITDSRSRYYKDPKEFGLCRSKFIVMETDGNSLDAQAECKKFWDRYCSYLMASPVEFAPFNVFNPGFAKSFTDNDATSCMQAEQINPSATREPENLKIELTWKNKTSLLGMTVIYGNEKLGYTKNSSTFGKYYSHSRTNKMVMLSCKPEKIKIVVEHLRDEPPIDPMVTISGLASGVVYRQIPIDNQQTRAISKKDGPQMFYSEDIPLTSTVSH